MPKRESTNLPNSNYMMNAFVGWGVTTLLMWLFRKRGGGDTDKQQASKYTDSNVNMIGNPVPVVLGRGMIKNPLVSYYGDYKAVPYTEEYGMHSRLSVKDIIFQMLMTALTIAMLPKKHIVITNTGTGYALDVENGRDNNLIMAAIIQFFLWLLTQLFNKHMGRTTIQKGFKYYLGWQHIICWGGKNIGFRKLWMNVYDTKKEASTEKPVLEDVKWEKDNPKGYTFHIDKPDLFGGVDEQGGFIGDVRIYFGTEEQEMDSWMLGEMNKSEKIPADLKNITPTYPIYLTSVIPQAYIGKQCTIPEMWFEVMNYPDTLGIMFKDELKKRYKKYLLSIAEELMQLVQKKYPATESLIRQSVYNPMRDAAEAKDVKILDGIHKDIIPKTMRNTVLSYVEDMREALKGGEWTLGIIGEDLNPAEAIYEIITNKFWGCNYSGDRIDMESLLELGITCEIERMGISCVIDSVAKANEYVNKILSHINGVKYDNPLTGKLTFKLIRNDFDADKIKSFDPDNCEQLEFTRLDWSETSSAVSTKFTDASNKYLDSELTYSDLSNRYITGNYELKKIECPYFTTAVNAKTYAKMQLLTLGYPLSSITFICNRLGHDLTIGEPISITWKPYGIDRMVCRITDIDYGSLEEGKIRVTAMEDVFSFEKTDYVEVDTPKWTENDKLPEEAGRYLFLELPYEMSRSLNTYLQAIVARPSQYTIYCNIWRHIGTSFARTSSTDSWGTVGRLVYGLEEKYENDDIGFEIQHIGYLGREKIEEKMNLIDADPDRYNNKSGLNLVDIDGEIISYNSIKKLPNGNYQLRGIIRGIYDTVPKRHTTESIAYFLDYMQNVNGNSEVAKKGNAVGEQLEIRTQSVQKEQPFDNDKIVNFRTTRRSERPTPMANLQFGSDRGESTEYKYSYPTTVSLAGDIAFKYNNRDKFSSIEMLSQTDPSINIPDTIRKYVKVSCNGREYETTELIYSEFCQKMGDYIKRNNTVNIEVGTYNTETKLHSYDKYEKSFNYLIPRKLKEVDTEEEAKTLAKTLCHETVIDIPYGGTMTYTECPLIFIKNTTKAYRIINKDGGLKEVEITPEYVYEAEDGIYRYRSGKHLKITL